ncbi:MAG: type II toxin-antitoxin system PemK/MazF family toxin [Mycobacteriales bacterium]
MSPGDAFWVELRGRGSEHRGRHPVIVVQAADMGFASTRLCVPTSTSAVPLSWPVEVELAGEQTVALTEQLRVVDIGSLRESLEGFIG